MSKTLLIIAFTLTLVFTSFAQDFAQNETAIRNEASKYGSDYAVTSDKFENTVIIKARFLNSDRLQGDIWLTSKTLGKRQRYSYSIFMRQNSRSIMDVDTYDSIIILADGENAATQRDVRVYYDAIPEGWAFSSIMIPDNKLIDKLASAEKIEIKAFYTARELDPKGREVIANMAKIFKALK